MASRDNALRRDHAGSAAQGLCLRHLSDGGERRRPGAVLDRAGKARHHPARRVPRAGAARPHRAHRPLHRRVRPRLRRRARRLRRARPGARAHLDQRAASARSIASCSTSAIATASRSMTATRWSAGSTACSLGRAFFGESMFHRARDASKIALVHLVARLQAGGFELLDTQFVTDHLKIVRRGRSAAAALSQAARSALIGERPISARCRSTHAQRRGRAAAARQRVDLAGNRCIGGGGDALRRCAAAAAAAAVARCCGWRCCGALRLRGGGAGSARRLGDRRLLRRLYSRSSQMS